MLPVYRVGGFLAAQHSNLSIYMVRVDFIPRLYYIIILSYRSLTVFFYLQSKKLACGLLEIGLKKGDCIGLLGPNTWQWYLSLLGAIQAGLVVVSIIRMIALWKSLKKKTITKYCTQIDAYEKFFSFLKKKSGNKLNFRQL